jgi:hypothetical protein
MRQFHAPCFEVTQVARDRRAPRTPSRARIALNPRPYAGLPGPRPIRLETIVPVLQPSPHLPAIGEPVSTISRRLWSTPMGKYVLVVPSTRHMVDDAISRPVLASRNGLYMLISTLQPQRRPPNKPGRLE